MAGGGTIPIETQVSQENDWIAVRQKYNGDRPFGNNTPTKEDLDAAYKEVKAANKSTNDIIKESAKKLTGTYKILK